MQIDDDLYRFDFDLQFDSAQPSLLEILTGQSMLEIAQDIRTVFNEVKVKTENFTQKATKELERRLNREKISVLRSKLKQKTLTDKITFVLGVTYISLTSFVIGAFPCYMPLYHLATVLPLIAVRWLIYKSKGWHYFLADLCYFVNALLILLLFFIPSVHLFTALFCLTHGPVLWAIYAWRNALVFHSLDKITSVAIHVAPAITLYTLRWLSYDAPESLAFPMFSYDPQFPDRSMDMNFSYAIMCASVVYWIWQGLYYYFILVVQREKVYGGERVTSFTWLLSSHLKKKQGNILTKMFMAAPSSWHAVMFMAVQFAYAILTMIPTIFFYHNFLAHTLFLTFMLMLSVFNGADYYMEVFSKRYVQELARLEQETKSPDGSFVRDQVVEPLEDKKKV